MIGFAYNDGGRKAAGFKGSTGDCTTRAIAIAMQRPYLEVYNEINALGKTERSTRRRPRKGSARTGIRRTTIRRHLASLGWTWVPTMKIGQGCKVHLQADELPSGRLIVSLSKHLCAVINGVVHDTYCDDRGGTRCVYGYWHKEQS